jgi:hypothetical protein
MESDGQRMEEVKGGQDEAKVDRIEVARKK